jgi:hypothetical protein
MELLKCFELLKACARAWDSSLDSRSLLGTCVSSFINGIPVSGCVCECCVRGAREHILVREYNLVSEHTFCSGIGVDELRCYLESVLLLECVLLFTHSTRVSA